MKALLLKPDRSRNTISFALPRNLTRVVAASVLLAGGGFAGAAERTGADPTNRIARISVRTDRVRESVIRRELAFCEGDVLVPEAIEESKRNLFRLNLLKTLAIEPEWDEALQGLHVRVEAEDGWFALPWPMAGSRGGSRYVSLTLMQLNFFRHAESMVLMGMLQDDEWSGLVAFSHPRYALMAGLFSSSRTEYAYADGAFSVKDFDGSAERERAEDFGEIVRAYDKTLDSAHLHALFPLGDDWRVSLGVKEIKARYGVVAPFDVPEPETLRALTMALFWGRAGAQVGGEGFVGMFGRIFGLGMAEAHDATRPLLATRTTWGGRAMLEFADSALGSDEDFVKAGLAAHRHTRFRNRDSLRFYAQAGWGERLPASQALTTGRESGMRGVYAREYRGDRSGVVGAAWNGTLWRDRVGQVGVNAFAEAGSVWQNGTRGDKQGLGAGLNYRFWRFPFPLGAGYTYSLDDRNGQISFAMGGMF